MRKAREITIAFLLTVAFTGSAKVPTVNFANGWEGLTPDQVRDLKAGKIVILDRDQSQGTDWQRFIQAAVIFEQPIDVVWGLFRQTARQEQYLAKLNKCVTVEDKGTYDKVDFFVKFSFISINYRVQHDFDPQNYYFYWSLDPGYKNKLKHLEGYWKLFKLDEQHTLARYGTIVNTSDLVPKSIQEVLTRQDLPQSLESVKKFIDSNGKYAKPGYTQK